LILGDRYQISPLIIVLVKIMNREEFMRMGDKFTSKKSFRIVIRTRTVAQVPGPTPNSPMKNTILLGPYRVFPGRLSVS
jgi:hypothetical protein